MEDEARNTSGSDPASGSARPEEDGRKTDREPRAARHVQVVQVDGYENLELVGRGGYATVWRATQVSVGRQVALKVMDHLDQPDVVKRFEAEISALVEVAGNPSTVHIYDAGRTVDGRPYLALEYVDGGSLGQLVRAEGPLQPAQVAAVGIALCDALAFAHRADVLHRDIKPDNVLIDRSGNPRLADFGIALVSGPSMSATAGAHSFRGTVLFSAPELLDGDPPSTATDIWGIGATLYMLCAGRAPFVVTSEGDAESLVGVIRRTLLEDPAPLPTTVPTPMSAAIIQCLAKDPSERPSSADDLRDLLVAAVEEAGLDLKARGSLRSAQGVATADGPSSDRAPGVQPAAGGSPSSATDDGESGRSIPAAPLGQETLDGAGDTSRRSFAPAILIALLIIAAVAGAWLLTGAQDGDEEASDTTDVDSPVLSFHGRGPRARADQVAMKALDMTPEEMAERFEQDNGPSSQVAITDGSLTDSSPDLMAKVDRFAETSSSPIMTGPHSRLPRGFQDLGYSYTPVTFNHRAINKVVNDTCYEVFDDELVMQGVAGALWTNDQMALTLTTMELGSVEDAEQFFAASTMFFGVEPTECRGWPEGGLAINATGMKVSRRDFPVSISPDQLYTAIATREELDPGIVADTQYSVVARSGKIVVAAQAVSFQANFDREVLRSAADEAAAHFLGN